MHDRTLRVRHEPKRSSQSYAQVRGLKENDEELYEALARDAFLSLIAIPAEDIIAPPAPVTKG